MTTSPRLLVVGKTGQVASALAYRLADDTFFKSALFGRPDLDLANTETIKPFLDAQMPDAILNAAAYTDVDGAETNEDEANAINHAGPAKIAEWCNETGAPFLHLSTDCVFDGSKDGGYLETDAPNPVSVYGRTKADGETAVASAAPKHLIVRVSWVHSQFGKSFPRTMLNLAKTRDTVSVVCDQFGRPTHALDLASGLITMAQTCLEPTFSDWGTYHLAGQGHVDRASMAEAVFEDSALFSGPTASVEHVSSQAFGAPAQRPLNSKLDSPRAAAVFGLRLPDWRNSLTDSVRAITQETDVV